MLAYNETSLPRAYLSERLELAKCYELAIEIANCGNLPISIYQQSGLEIAAIQAYRMHDFHPLHPELEYRQMGLTHVCETLEIAAKLNAPHIVTVCGFGSDLVDKPQERCRDFFAAAGDRAGELGIKIAIEPLSPKKVAKFNSAHEVVELIETLNRPEVFFLLLDTGHLADSNVDLNTFFRTGKYPLLELQLKGLNSAPPQLDIPLKSWLQSLDKLPEVICIEHRQPINFTDFDRLINRLKNSLDSL